MALVSLHQAFMRPTETMHRCVPCLPKLSIMEMVGVLKYNCVLQQIKAEKEKTGSFYFIKSHISLHVHIKSQYDRIIGMAVSGVVLINDSSSKHKLLQ